MSQQPGPDAQAIPIEERNPYAPSSAVLNAGSAATTADVSLELASQSRRLANFLIDVVVYFLIMFVIGIVIAVVNMNYGMDLTGFMGPFSGFGVSFFYHFLTESLSGKTAGKYLTRTRVVDESGAPAKVWQIALRSLYRFVPFDAFSFLGKQRPGWHDRWSKTRVIMDRPA